MFIVSKSSNSVKSIDFSVAVHRESLPNHRCCFCFLSSGSYLQESLTVSPLCSTHVRSTGCVSPGPKCISGFTGGIAGCMDEAVALLLWKSVTVSQLT